MAENDEPMIQTPADFGHFVLEKELGHGGMGGVYLARDKMLDRRVGIKVMLRSLGADPKFVERFQREAQAAARLNHPNIAQIYSFGQEQGMPYIAMELVPGGSLDKEMEANPGALDVVYVMRVGQQVADALALAAESGLVHGDVKPENVLFDSDGNAKLVDFGLAAMQGDSDEIWGTPYYISPEKVRRQKIDYRADIYSLGGTLYHVLTGVPPFDGPDPTAVVKARFDGPPKKPSEIRPEIPPEVDAIIMRMLELEPSMRYPTYQSLLGDFKRYLAKAGPAKTTKTTGPKLKFKGMKPKVSVSAAGTGNMAPADGEVADLQPVADLDGEEEEEKKSMGVGAMVGLVAGGVLLLLLLVGVGLWWYTSSTNASKEQQSSKQVAEQQNKANLAIEESMKNLQDAYKGFHEAVLKAEKDVEQAKRAVEGALPEEMKAAAAAVFAPQPPPAAEEKAATTNAVATAADAKKTDAKKDEKKDDVKKADGKMADAKKVDDKKSDDKNADAKKVDDKKADDKKADDKKADDKKADDKKADDKKADDKKEEPVAPAEQLAAEEAKPAEETKPKMPLPSAVKNYVKLLENLDKCQKADARFKERMDELLAKAKNAENLTEQDKETADALGQLANDLNGAYTSLLNEKWLKEAQKTLKRIEKDAAKYTKDALASIKVEVDKRNREEKKKAEEAEKAAKKAAEEAARKKLIEEEEAKAQEAFDELSEELKAIGNWSSCMRKLNRLKERMKTKEGEAAAEVQLKKVEFMEGLRKFLAENAKDFRFKDRKGNVVAIVKESNDKAFTIQKQKYVAGKWSPDKSTTVPWDEFYTLNDQVKKYSDFKGQFSGYMNQFIMELVINGRINGRDQSEHMLGAALTLKYLHSDKPGVDKFIPQLVKAAVDGIKGEKGWKDVKGFGHNRKWAVKWFPDVELSEPEDPVE